MKKQVITRETNRREMLKLSGMGVLGGVAVNALTPGKAQAVEGPVGISYASWIHGHSMQIEYPDRIAYQRRTGMSFDIEGKPGTDNWFHFAIPTPVIINDVRLQADSIMLRFRTASVDAFVRHVHVYDGEFRIAQHDDINLSGENLSLRLVVPDRPEMLWGLGISLGVGFGVEMMDHRMEFIAAGCDFVIREPV
jgi:hypothetical protein